MNLSREKLVSKFAFKCNLYRYKVEAQKLAVVGWYHSHPVFEPTPSGVDIDNQLNYQRLFRDDNTGVEPFVVGTPYKFANPVHP